MFYSTDLADKALFLSSVKDFMLTGFLKHQGYIPTALALRLLYRQAHGRLS
jgi:hypothetical protein